MGLTAISYGGGVQSTALLVLAARGEIEANAALFANVGDDSEHPDTLRYVREVATPYAERHGLALHDLAGARTLYASLMRVGSRSVGIPVRMANGAPGRRDCTVAFKIRRVARWLRQHGATADDPGAVLLGISTDEFHRARSDSGIPHVRLAHPLIERRLTRADCARLIEDAGLPVPPKSSCYFCPFHSFATWRRLRNDRPDLFDRAVALERRINENRAAMGRDNVWLTNRLIPLDSAVGGARQTDMFDGDGDAAGSCGPFACAGDAAIAEIERAARGGRA